MATQYDPNDNAFGPQGIPMTDDVYIVTAKDIIDGIGQYKNMEIRACDREACEKWGDKNAERIMGLYNKPQNSNHPEPLK